MTYIFLQFYYIFMFEARYLMKRLLLHVLFSHFSCVILIFLFSFKYYISLTIYYVARKIAVMLRQISFSVCQRVGIV